MDFPRTLNLTANGFTLETELLTIIQSFFFFKLYIIVLVLRNIKMNLPQVKMSLYLFAKVSKDGF